MISVNGSAARRAALGDRIINAAFARVHDWKLAQYMPQLILVDQDNMQNAKCKAPRRVNPADAVICAGH
jgi:aspartate 1-decarboxylase